MSALSEQCEALRMWAKHLREGEPALASDLREAADTILNLRDMAQQAQSEKAALERRIDELCAEVEAEKQRNAKLFEAAKKWMAKAAHFEAENDKLRELVSDYSDCLDTALCLASDAGYPVMPARDKFLSLERRKREMGIEVDG